MSRAFASVLPALFAAFPLSVVVRANVQSRRGKRLERRLLFVRADLAGLNLVMWDTYGEHALG